MIKEFELIKRLTSLTNGDDQTVILGIGDDAAIIDPALIPETQKIVIATDTLVANRHFNSDDKPEDIGHKSLAVNLSDMAAMCANPKWVLMNLTLPDIDEIWLQGFIDGVGGLLKKYQVELIGGDTTSGPLAIGFTVIGFTEKPKKRQDAQEGDLIVVSGELGSAAYALHHPNQSTHCDNQLKRPLPRLDISEAVKDFARSMIDVSDGLVADLVHICEASNLGGRIDLDEIPVHDAIKNDPAWRDYVLSGGDDYQLCFTIRPEDADLLPEDCNVIGFMQAGDKVEVYENGHRLELDQSGFDHFG